MRARTLRRILIWRFLPSPFQTLNSISAEKNSTIIFPLPIDLLSQFMNNGAEKEEKID